MTQSIDTDVGPRFGRTYALNSGFNSVPTDIPQPLMRPDLFVHCRSISPSGNSPSAIATGQLKCKHSADEVLSLFVELVWPRDAPLPVFFDKLFIAMITLGNKWLQQ